MLVYLSIISTRGEIVRIDCDQDKKMVSVWLSREERKNDDIKNQLCVLRSVAKESRYLIAEFISGDEDLFCNTAELLKRNKNLQI